MSSPLYAALVNLFPKTITTQEMPNLGPSCFGLSARSGSRRGMAEIGQSGLTVSPWAPKKKVAMLYSQSQR